MDLSARLPQLARRAPAAGRSAVCWPARDYAVRDQQLHWKTERGAKLSSANLTLAALDHLHRSLGADQPNVRREELPQQAPRALARLPLYTGLRLAEPAALNLEDVAISARKVLVNIRSGRGEAYREVPLNADVRQALDLWLAERREQFAQATIGALLLSLRGRPLSTRAMDLIVRQLGADAGLTLSAHALRHTWLTNLVRRGNPLVMVAELAGRNRLGTTRRYSRPSAADRQAAMEALRVEHRRSQHLLQRGRARAAGLVPGGDQRRRTDRLPCPDGSRPDGRSASPRRRQPPGLCPPTRLPALAWVLPGAPIRRPAGGQRRPGPAAWPFAVRLGGLR